MVLRKASTPLWLTVLAVGTALLPSDAGADTVADFYRGKTINVYIGVNVGGGYDFEARLLARFMRAHIPGNPVLVPQNMIGAGGLFHRPAGRHGHRHVSQHVDRRAGCRHRRRSI